MLLCGNKKHCQVGSANILVVQFLPKLQQESPLETYDFINFKINTFELVLEFRRFVVILSTEAKMARSFIIPLKNFRISVEN
jgi:hypothetical protein